MKPASFRYLRPDSVEETLSVLAQHGSAARILAGGQSLLPAMNFRLARPDYLVDVNRLRDLARIDVDDRVLVIGALVRHRTIARSALISKHAPLMTQAAPFVGHQAIRNRGTIGGSLAHADPAAEWPAVGVALDAECTLVSSGGRRVTPLDQFIVDYLTTSRDDEELLAEVRIPIPPARTGYGFFEIARRHGDFAIVAVAVLLTVRASGSVESARIVFAGAGPRPMRARQAEQILVGSPPTDEALREASRIAAQETEPMSDIHATDAYRRHIASVLCRRALEHARDRAAGAVA
jgi:CO/xanthine dehydrogenase FAD-binding subunit